MSFSLDSATPEEIARSADKIRALMESVSQSLDSLCEGVSISAPDDVRQFLATRAGVVPVIDARLAVCGDLLRRGLRSEALSREAEAPPLVETAELLDISTHDNWSTWQLGLTGQEMPEPVKPRLDLVAALKQARKEVQRLKPLLDRWRRLNLNNAALPDKIELLRKLCKADQTNKVWGETLVEHEGQRLRQIETDIKQATRERDEPWLERLVEELSAEWVEAKPKGLLAAAKAALDSFRGSRIDHEIDEVGASLAAAHEARDLDAARELVRRWKPLAEEKGAADPGDARLAAAAPAVAWVENHDRMRALADEIWQSLDATPGGLRAWRQWVRGLGRMGAEMEDLAEKLPGEVDVEAVQRALERIARKQYELDRHEAFRRKLMYIAAGSAAVVLAVAVWWIDDQVRLSRKIKAAIAQLDRQLEECQAGGGGDPSEYIEGLESRVRRDETVASKIVSLEGCTLNQGERRQKLAELLEQATTLTAAAGGTDRSDPLAPWPEEFAKATVVIQQIDREQLVKALGERGDVERATSAINDLAKRWTAAADLDLDRRAAVIDEALDKARLVLASDVATAESLATRATAEIEAARSLAETQAAAEASENYSAKRVASPAAVASFGRDGDLARKAAELQQLIAKRRGFSEQVASLPAAIGRWQEYGQLLEQVATTYDNLSEAASFGEAAERLPQWEGVEIWKEFTKKLPPLDRCSPEQAKGTIDAFKALPPAVRGLPMAARFAADAIPALETFAGRDVAFLQDNLATWFEGTFQAELAYVVTDGAGRKYYCLEPPPGDPKPEVNQRFDYVTKWDGNWTTKKSTAEAVTVDESPQRKLAAKIKSQFTEAAIRSGLDLDEVLIKALAQTVAAADLDPVVQLVAAFKYSQLASTYSRPVENHVPNVTGLFKAGQGLVAGLSLESLATFGGPDRDRNVDYNIGVKNSREIIPELRDQLPKLAEAVKAERARLAKATGDVPELVGLMSLEPGGAAVPVWKDKKDKQPTGPVLWISSATEFSEAGRIEPDGSFKPAARTAPVGTPLWRLGPTPGQAKEAKTR